MDDVDVWWPALSEYDPGISKERWVDILNNPDYINSDLGGVLAKFYDYGGAATCSQIAERYGGNPLSLRGYCTKLAKSIQKATDCPMYDGDEERNRYWPIIFQGRKASSDIKGNWVWRFLRSELPMNISIKETIDQIKSYIAAKGFPYDGRLIENFLSEFEE